MQGWSHREDLSNPNHPNEERTFTVIHTWGLWLLLEEWWWVIMSLVEYLDECCFVERRIILPSEHVFWLLSPPQTCNLGVEGEEWVRLSMDQLGTFGVTAPMRRPADLPQGQWSPRLPRAIRLAFPLQAVWPVWGPSTCLVAFSLSQWTGINDTSRWETQRWGHVRISVDSSTCP